ncbi:hypothetical protein [Phytohalomonas tamaricis]|uniref:hypothetical protein n=1 Tax=Phytohalomonas tamaricis TaxID=2081032 RepID=UPI000D0B0B01|nr:hypothetical protein [Phytohalomonas tamaricis]
MTYSSSHLSLLRHLNVSAVLSVILVWSLTASAETTIATPVQPAPPTPPVIAQPQPVQPRPVQPRPVQPNPVQPHPVQPRPIQPGLDVDVIVAPQVAPQTEHWPSNYVPDNYQLRGYGGNGAASDSEQQRNGKQVCHHADGSTTWSTSGVPCPDDRGDPPGTKTWSTK